ncbi:MAG: caspase family protein [Bacteroidota bacterium]
MNNLNKTFAFAFLLMLMSKFLYAQKPELVIPAGHGASIYATAISSDGKYLVTASRDKTVKLWDVAIGAEIKTYTMHTNGVRFVDISPDNQFIVSGGDYFDNQVILFRLTTGEILMKYEMKYGITSIAFSPDGRTVRACGNDPDNSYREWSVPSGNLLHKASDFGDSRKIFWYISPSGKYGFTQHSVWDLDSMSILYKVISNNLGYHIFCSNTGKYYLSKNPRTKIFSLRSSEQSLSLIDFTQIDKDNISIEAAFSPDDQFAALAYSPHKLGEPGHFSEFNIELWNIQTLQRIKSGRFYSDIISLEYTPDGLQLIITDIENKIYFWDIKDWKVSRKMGGKSVEMFANLDKSRQNIIVSRSNSNQLKIRLKTGRLTQTDESYEIINYIGNGKFTLACDTAHWMIVSQGTGKKTLVGHGTYNQYITSAGIVPDSSTAYISCRKFTNDSTKVVERWNLSTGQMEGIIGNDVPLKDAEISPNAIYMFALRGKTENRTDQSRDCWELWDLNTNTIKSRFEQLPTQTVISNASFTNDDKYLLFGSFGLNRDMTDLYLLETSSGKILKKTRIRNKTAYIENISDDNQFIVFRVLESNDILVYDVHSLTETAVLKGNIGRINCTAFSENNKYLIASVGSQVKIWDMASRKELLSFIPLENNEWIVTTPDGRFDGTAGGMKMLYFVQGLDVLPIESFYEQLYTPNLWSRVISGEKMEAVAINFSKKISLPPKVKITSPQHHSNSSTPAIIVNVDITDQGGGIDEVRLFHNGKLVDGTSRGFQPLAQTGSKNTKTFLVNLINGANVIKATAFNNDRTESVPEEITVFYQGVTSTSDLYLFCIGINNYKNAKYNLNYAQPDALGFMETVKDGSSDIFSNVFTFFLQNEKAVKADIVNVFNQIIAKAKQQDVLVFFFAGHGVMSEGINNLKSEFYLVPNDVVQLYGNDGGLLQKALSSNELIDYSKRIQAQKQLFVIDACQSGGAVETFASRGAAEEKAIMQLARSTGICLLSASGSEQIASEFSQLGHGVFTFSLIEGLQGKADGGTLDKKITVNELKAYIEERVPELTQEYKGQAQYPNGSLRGQDFPLVVVK